MKSPSDLAAAGTRPEVAPGPDSTRPRRAVRRLHAGAVIAVALAVGFGAWLLLRDTGGKAPVTPVSRAVTLQALQALPDRAGHPVYWAGPRAGYTYELTRPTDGNVYVRYLPAGVPIGSARPDFLTIGSYPRPRALRLLRQLARSAAAVSFPVRGGGLAVYGRDKPNSVYLAFPGGDVQIEVYDPSARQARRLARSGQVRPVR